MLKEKDFEPSRNNIAQFINLKLRELKITLPSENIYRRLVNFLRQQFYNKFYDDIYKGLSEKLLMA